MQLGFCNIALMGRVAAMYSGSRQATCYTLTKFGTWLEGKSRAYPQGFFFFLKSTIYYIGHVGSP